VSGGGHSGGGVCISTSDHARFGLLFLRRANWNGEQLISERWIDQATTSSTANESYGYMWWVNRGERAWEGVSPSVYYAAGFGGNFIIIDNENDLVIVTRWLNPPQVGEMVRLVQAAIEK
ncbi:MAG: serine hydrolase, partial [Tunicatimonas sp.]